MQLQELNEKVKATAEKLSHTAWLAHRQRENLHNLIFSPRGATSTDCLPIIPCLRANKLVRIRHIFDCYFELTIMYLLMFSYRKKLHSKMPISI